MQEALSYHLSMRPLAHEGLYLMLSKDSLPDATWSSPVVAAVDSDYRYYWRVRSIFANPRLATIDGGFATVIFEESLHEGEKKGVYLFGKSSVSLDLTPFKTQPLTDAECGIEDDSEFYTFMPERAWLLGENVELEGYLIDRKVEQELRCLSGTYEQLGFAA